MASLLSPVRLGIKAKFIGILIIAAALPLAIGLASVWVLGFRDFKSERGVLFQSAATHLALGLSGTIQSQIEELDELIHNSDLSSQLHRENERHASLTDAELSNRVAAIEARWPSLQESDAELQSVLTNEVALRLGEFRLRHPFFAEIFVTDARGRIIGATGKTSGYWQSNEDWWQRAFALGTGQAHLDGVHFEESARVHSIDIAIPIFDRSLPSRKLGVIKGVLNASPLFFSVEPLVNATEAERQLVLGDGRILISLSGQEKVLPLRQSVDDAVARALANGSGWIEAGNSSNRRLVGFSPVMASKSPTAHIHASGLAPLYVIVHDRIATVMFPVRQQFWMLTLTGVATIFVFSLIGLFIATRKIIRPIRSLRLAAQTIAASARSGGTATGKPADVGLRQVARIDTADEIEFLAKDFLVMATHILRYQDQLNEEIAVKTAEIQRDLEVAREFQEALMPRSYPQVPSPPDSDALSLNFHHVYLPTSSVGGDFFDVMKLSDHRAGIFIADVMGHGARSALVTAILRTLLQDLAAKANDPAQFLSLLNRHFHSIIEQSNQFIFVSAFYLLIDTEHATASYASAGHPPPFVADRSTRRVEPLIERLENNPALGLFPESSHQNFSRPIKANDVFLLFTDGVFELMNPEGEEFGRERLRQTIERNLDVPAHTLTERVIEALDEFRSTVAPADDICLVACEIRPATSYKPQPAATKAALA